MFTFIFVYKFCRRQNRIKKTKDLFPRSAAGPLHPIVRCQSHQSSFWAWIHFGWTESMFFSVFYISHVCLMLFNYYRVLVWLLALHVLLVLPFILVVSTNQLNHARRTSCSQHNIRIKHMKNVNWWHNCKERSCQSRMLNLLSNFVKLPIRRRHFLPLNQFDKPAPMPDRLVFAPSKPEKQLKLMKWRNNKKVILKFFFPLNYANITVRKK